MLLMQTDGTTTVQTVLNELASRQIKFALITLPHVLSQGRADWPFGLGAIRFEPQFKDKVLDYDVHLEYDPSDQIMIGSFLTIGEKEEREPLCELKTYTCLDDALKLYELQAELYEQHVSDHC